LRRPLDLGGERGRAGEDRLVVALLEVRLQRGDGVVGGLELVGGVLRGILADRGQRCLGVGDGLGRGLLLAGAADGEQRGGEAGDEE
jgi:hypothetical protein